MRIRRRLAAVAMLFGLAVASEPSLTSATSPALPANFLAVSSGQGVRWNMSLYSTATGAITQRLATFGNSLTNNGLALAPDDSAVYFTLIPSHPGRRFGLCSTLG